MNSSLSPYVCVCVCCVQDVGFWMRVDKQEVEIVDFLLQVKDCLDTHTH